MRFFLLEDLCGLQGTCRIVVSVLSIIVGLHLRLISQERLTFAQPVEVWSWGSRFTQSALNKERLLDLVRR